MSDQLLDKQLPDLSHLTDEERQKILDVLNRDDLLQQKQSSKLIKLRQEIDILESKSIDIPKEHIETATICVRCKQSFGYFYFYNQGDFCPKCKYKVCQKCQIYQLDINTKWLCILCHKNNQYLIQTGQWIQPDTDIHNNSGHGVLRKDSLSGSQIIKLTLLPEKKEEILGEITKTQMPKSTLTRTASVLKSKKQALRQSRNINKPAAHTSTSPTVAMLENKALQANSSPTNNKYDSKQSTSNNMRNLTIVTDPILPTPRKTSISYDIRSNQESTRPTKSILARQNSILSHRQSIIRNNSVSTVVDGEKTPRNNIDKHFQFAESKANEIKKISDNDLDSVTSSELDSVSINSDLKSPQLSERSFRFKNTMEQLSKNNLKTFNKITDSDIDETNLFRLKDDSMSRTSMASSVSKKFNEQQSDRDDTSLQMDKIFTQAKETIKTSEDLMNIKLEDMLHMQQDDDAIKPIIDNSTEPKNSIEPVKSNKLRTLSSHMSLIRRNKKLPKFERSVSIKSVEQDDSMYSADVQGRIQLKLDYDKKSSNLNVKIIQCSDLAPVANKSCDSYVKIYLIPGSKDKNNKRKTSIKKNSLNPEFNETLRYVLGHYDLCRNKLWISVWHSDKFGRNKFLGEINIQLEPEILVDNSPKWYELIKRTVADQ